MSRTFNGPSPTRGRRCKVIQTFPSDPLRACQFPHRLQDSQAWSICIHGRWRRKTRAAGRTCFSPGSRSQYWDARKELIDTGRVQVGAASGPARSVPRCRPTGGVETGPVLPHDVLRVMARCRRRSRSLTPTRGSPRSTSLPAWPAIRRRRDFRGHTVASVARTLSASCR